MVSGYELITIAELELFHASVDYETKYGYSDAVVESWITAAEEMVIGITEVVWSATTVTPGVKVVVKMWAKQYALNQMIEDNHTSQKNPESKTERWLIDITKSLIKPATAKRTIFVDRD